MRKIFFRLLAKVLGTYLKRYDDKFNLSSRELDTIDDFIDYIYCELK